MRIEAAKKRLESSREAVSDIAWQAGCGDTSSFCRLFRKTTGLSPRDYRAKFCRPPGGLTGGGRMGGQGLAG